MTMELGGRVTIVCKQNNLQAELEFKLKVVLGLGSSEPSGIPLTSLCPGDGFLSKCTWVQLLVAQGSSGGTRPQAT